MKGATRESTKKGKCRWATMMNKNIGSRTSHLRWMLVATPPTPVRCVHHIRVLSFPHALLNNCQHCRVHHVSCLRISGRPDEALQDSRYRYLIHNNWASFPSLGHSCASRTLLSGCRPFVLPLRIHIQKILFLTLPKQHFRVSGS